MSTLSAPRPISSSVVKRILMVPCRISGLADQRRRGGHDLGDAGLVVGAQQGGAVGGDDVVADLLLEVGMLGDLDDAAGVAAELDVAALVVADDIGF
jgi:hypothetical protein